MKRLNLKLLLVRVVLMANLAHYLQSLRLGYIQGLYGKYPAID